jgi:hypothetical protein
MIKYGSSDSPLRKRHKVQLMKNILKFGIAAIALFVASASLACDYPQRPHIPDGATASKDELLAAKQDVQDFLAQVDEYLRCVEAEEQAAVNSLDNPDPETIQARETELNKKFDAANDEKALVGEQFNQQVRAYNKKRKESE